MHPLSSGGRSPGRTRPAPAVAWFATPRQRLRVYVVVAVIAGLGCSSVDYNINANLMRCVIKTAS